MSHKVLVCAATFFLAALSCQSAAAVEGSFTGTASGIRHPLFSGEEIPFFGEPVVGTFSFDTSLPDPDGCCSAPVLEDGKLSYSAFVFQFDLHAFGRDIGSAGLDEFPNGVTWAQDGPGQSLTVTGGGPYWYWTLGLVDPDGGMFRDFDPLTFDPTQVNVGMSYFNFSDDIRSYGAVVAFDSLTLDGHALPVPEPTTLGLFGAGLLLLAFTGRRARGARSAPR